MFDLFSEDTEPVDLDAILNSQIHEELPFPGFTDYYQAGCTSTFELALKEKWLQDSKARYISVVDAAELVGVFYNSVVKTGVVGRTKDAYQGWLTQSDNSCLDYRTISFSAQTASQSNRQNYAEGHGSIHAGFSADGSPLLDDCKYLFPVTSNISTGQISNSPMWWSYDVSACMQYSKLKHLFKLYQTSVHECFYIELFTTFDYSTIFSLSLSFAFDISKGQTGTVNSNAVHAPRSFERPRVKDVLATDTPFCLDVVVVLAALSEYLPQAFWKPNVGGYSYLDPISCIKQADGTEVLRVRIPELESERQVTIGVKAKYFDDLYSNVVIYNAPPISAFTCQKYIKPVKLNIATASPALSLDRLTPVQYPLSVFPIKSAMLACSPDTKVEPFVPVESLTPLQLLSFRGSTLACTYAIKGQVTKLEVEDSFEVLSCAVFSGNMRTFIVCQAFHLWNMQLLEKDALLKLLELVINHDHFGNPLAPAEMFACLPRDLEAEKQLAQICGLFSGPYQQRSQDAFNQLLFVASNGFKASGECEVVTQSTLYTEINTSPSSQHQTALVRHTSSTIAPSLPTLQTPQTPQTPHSPQTNQTHQTPHNQRVVTYQEISNLLASSNININAFTPPTSLTPLVPERYTSTFASAPFTAHLSYSWKNTDIPAFPSEQTIQPTQLMLPSHYIQPQTQAPLITLAEPVQPYQHDETDPVPKRLKVTVCPSDAILPSKYIQSKHYWKTQRTHYPTIPALYIPPPEIPRPAPVRPVTRAKPVQTTSYALGQVFPPPPLVQHQVFHPDLAQVQQVQQELVAQTLEKAQQHAAQLEACFQAELPAPQNIQQDQQLYQLPLQQHEQVQGQHSLVQVPLRILPPQIVTHEPETQIPVDAPSSPQPSSPNQGPWQLRRHCRSRAAKQSKSTSPLQSRWKLTKAVSPPQSPPENEPITQKLEQRTRKQRLVKAKREKDEDYEDEEAEQDDEDDGEYVLTNRRRSSAKRKSSADSHRSTSQARRSAECHCKLCKLGLPPNSQKMAWADIAFVAFACLSQTSKSNATCFSLQGEILPFIEKHYDDLVQINVHRNSWKKEIQSALTNSDLFVCIKEDRTSLSSELWTMRTSKDPWECEELEKVIHISPAAQSESDYESDDSREICEFEEEMNSRLVTMREQFHATQCQRDFLAKELTRAKKDVDTCTDSLYNLVSAGASAQSSPDSCAKAFDEIFDKLLDDIHQILGDYTERILAR